MSIATLATATANYDGTVEIAVHTKSWPTTTCTTVPICTLNVGAGAGPTFNPDCEVILERCESSEFFIVRSSFTVFLTSQWPFPR